MNTNNKKEHTMKKTQVVLTQDIFSKLLKDLESELNIKTKRERTELYKEMANQSVLERTDVLHNVFLDRLIRHCIENYLNNRYN
jgi:hypothetical protein